MTLLDVSAEAVHATTPASAQADAEAVLQKGCGEYGCSHYRRRCKIKAPCCNEVFDCRHCHNDAKSHSEDKSRHEIARHNIERVVCSLCSTEQKVQQVCEACGVCMGRYFCFKCKFYDDEVAKKHFHCDECGICRVGGKDKFFHCDKCGCCYATSLREDHRCVEKSMHHNCPVCFEFLFESLRETSVLRECGHTIHTECLDELRKHNRYACPICCKTMFDMSRVWAQLDQEVAATPMPEAYQNQMTPILCNDCGGSGSVPFHVVGHKCPHCGSYNTRQTQYIGVMTEAARIFAHNYSADVLLLRPLSSLTTAKYRSPVFPHTIVYQQTVITLAADDDHVAVLHTRSPSNAGGACFLRFIAACYLSHSPLFPSPSPTPTTHGPPSSPSSRSPPQLPSLIFPHPCLFPSPFSSLIFPILSHPPPSSLVPLPNSLSLPPLSSPNPLQSPQSFHAEFPSAWQALASLPQPLGQPELATWHPLPPEEPGEGKGEHGGQGELGGNGAVEHQREEWGEVVGGGQRGSMGQQRYCTYVDEFVKAGRGDEVGAVLFRCYGCLFPSLQPLLPPVIPQPSSSISPPLVFPFPPSSSSLPTLFSPVQPTKQSVPNPTPLPPLSPSPSLSPSLSLSPLPPFSPLPSLSLPFPPSLPFPSPCQPSLASLPPAAPILRKLILSACPSIDGAGVFRPYLKVFRRGAEVSSSVLPGEVPPSFPTGSAWMVPFEVNAPVWGDCAFAVHHWTGNSSRDESEPVFVFAFHSAFLRIGLTRITLHELDCAYGGDVQVPADFFIDVLIEMPQPHGGTPLADDAHSDGAPAGAMLTWQQLLAAYRDEFVEASRKQRMSQGREETQQRNAARSERGGEEAVSGRGSALDQGNEVRGAWDWRSEARGASEQQTLEQRLEQRHETVGGRGANLQPGNEAREQRRSLARSLVTEVQAHPLLRHTGQPSHPGMPVMQPVPPGMMFMPPEVMSSQHDLPTTPTTPHMPPSPHSPLPHSPLPQLPSLSEEFSLSHSSSAASPAASQPSQELDSLADLLIRMSLSTGSRHSMGGGGLKGGERHGMGGKGVSFEQGRERHSMGGGNVKERAGGEGSMVGGAERMGQEGSMGGKRTMGVAGGMRGEGGMGDAEGMGEENQRMGNGGAYVSAIRGEGRMGGAEGMGREWEGMGGGDAMGGRREGKGMGSDDVRVVREGREAGGEWGAGAASGKLAAPGMGRQQGEGEGGSAEGEGDLFPPARPLHWNKVTNVKGTVWEEIERDGAGKKEREETVGDGGIKGSSSNVLVLKVTLPDDMRRAIRVLFQVKATKPGGKSKTGGGLQAEGGGQGGRKGLGKDELQVVGLARANNVAIMLTQFRMPENQIRDLILAGDPKHVLPPDRLGLLLQVIPTEEEVAKFRAVSGAASGAMCAPERFLWSISLIPRMRRKIEALMFVRHFHTIVNDARAVIKVFCSAAREIRSSKVLRAALAAALEVGNELNRGSSRGSARGFSLDSLARLSEVRVTPPSHRAKGLDSLFTASQVAFESAQKGCHSTGPEGGEEEAGEVGSSLVGSAVRNKGGEGGAGRRGKLTVELAAVGEAVRMSQADVADATSALDTGLRLVDEEALFASLWSFASLFDRAQATLDM
ncbi:unnamed protein product [Closterium sp. Naga37s-1]|nr:unnamed protein product [Closterium sp. Naga37s-1]